MTDATRVHFYPPDELFERSAKIFAQEKQFLHSLLGDLEIQHVGSSAVPGAWGKYDVDIQIRVPQEKFNEVMKKLIPVLSPKHVAIWDDRFGLFSEQSGTLIDIDYMVTVIGDYRDDYYKMRDYFINSPVALDEYNKLKLKFGGKPYDEYRIAKKEFMKNHGGQW
ncbi:MAG: GrpB family protein [bacterium]